MQPPIWKRRFFHMKANVARTQYGARDRSAPNRTWLCAAWWCSYHRLQPGSGSGTQSLESFHAHDFRGSFVDPQTGRPLSHMSPDVFPPALRETVLYQSRQLRKLRGTLPDHPNGADPTSRNSTLLQRIGRCTALDFAQNDDLIHRIEVSHGEDVFVMPRSFYHRQRNITTPPRVQVWTRLPRSRLIFSEAEANHSNCTCK